MSFTNPNWVGAARMMGGIDFRFLAENSSDMICVLGLDHKFTYVSPSSAHVLGWAPKELQGKCFDDYVNPEDGPALQAAVLRSLNPDVGRETLTARMLRKDGRYVWIELNSSIIRSEGSSEPEQYIAVIRDINDRKLLEQKLEQMSLTDGLTGIANRRAFDLSLEKDWLRTVRDGGHVSLLLLDIDHFKMFNDQYGHQAGDDCLRAVAKILAGCLRRPGDLAARYGGEELAVILPDTNASGALAVAEGIRSAVASLSIPHANQGEDREVLTVSIGVATAMAVDGASVQMPAGLLQAADHALYKAKHEGRNRVATALLMTQSTN